MRVTCIILRAHMAHAHYVCVPRSNCTRIDCTPPGPARTTRHTTAHHGCMQGVRCPAVEVDGGVTGLYYKLTLLSMLTILGDGYTYYGVLRACL